MTSKQLEALKEFIRATVKEVCLDMLQRDSLSETVRRQQLEVELNKAFLFQQDPYKE